MPQSPSDSHADLLGLERRVVANTVRQGGLSSACDGKVFRIDVGLADYYNRPLQVLEILGGIATVLK